MIKEFKVDTFIERLYCDHCGTEMKSDDSGIVLLTSPPLYPYVCSGCGETTNKNNKYPQTVYKEIWMGGSVMD